MRLIQHKITILAAGLKLEAERPITFGAVFTVNLKILTES